MRTSYFLAAVLTAAYCPYLPLSITEVEPDLPNVNIHSAFSADPWQKFLQNLPTKKGKILDYTGRPIANQDKHSALLTYDVGKRDLQQCADALIRLRAEYLFQQQHFDRISFQFTSGHHYSWGDYCKGLQPRIRGNQVHFVRGPSRPPTYSSLRTYLDIVYTYAGTQSLFRELKPVKEFSIGTIIIKPGSPGHCCIIIDEAVRRDGTKVYKLAESYMPAQSIYILKNPADGSPWHELKEGASIKTSSFYFTSYSLRQF